MSTHDFDANLFDFHSRDSTFLIEANAGTGKTYNIQQLYRRLIEEEDLKVSEILVVTYTELATAELRDRIRSGLTKAAEKYEGTTSPSDLLKRNRLLLANASFDEACIFTIHGFCRQALTHFSFEGGISSQLEINPNFQKLIRETVMDFYRRKTTQQKACPLKMDQLLKAANSFLKKPEPQFRLLGKQELFSRLKQELDAAIVPKGKNKFTRALIEAKQLVLQELNAVENDFDTCIQTLAGEFKKEHRDCFPVLFSAVDDWKQANYIYLELKEFLFDPVFGFEARKGKAKQMSFDDLLTQMRDAINRNPNSPMACQLREEYKIALVDEFQDTDPLQYEIFTTVFDYPGYQLILIGDPKQAIYRFRGGDIYAYLNAKKRVASDNRFTLTKNYRSEKTLISRINDLFTPEHAFLEDAIVYHCSEYGDLSRDQLLKDGKPLSQPVKMIWYPGDPNTLSPDPASRVESIFLDAAVQTALSILHDDSYQIHEQKDGKDRYRRLQPQDFAFLLNQNAQCKCLKEALCARGIPAVLQQSNHIYRSEEAIELFYVLSAVLNPHKKSDVRRAFITRMFGRNFTTVYASLREESSELETAAESLVGIREVWYCAGIMQALSKLEEVFHCYENAVLFPNAERILVNWRHLSELLHQEEQFNQSTPESLLLFLRGEIEDQSGDNQTEETEERLETDRNAAVVMTIHKSKGLEFPIVICPTLALKSAKQEQTLFSSVHVSSAEGNQTFLITNATDMQKYQDELQWENLGESLRLLYVALTRASQYCIIFGGNIGYGKKANYQNALNYLGHLQSADSCQNFDLLKERRVPELREPGLESPFHSLDYETLVKDKKSEDVYDTGLDREDLPELISPASYRFRKVYNRFSILSYTSMSEHQSVQSDQIQGGEDEADVSPASLERLSDSLLPPGKQSGLMLHKILEMIDFRDELKWDSVIRAQLLFYHHDQDPSIERVDAVMKVLRNAVQYRILESVSLQEVPMEDTQREWKFYLPALQGVRVDELMRLGLHFKEFAGIGRGYLTGEIDLLFRSRGKYYFADWKSDILPAYDDNTLRTRMLQYGYYFQAIIYASALYLFLKKSLSDFQYEKHFGGGYYYFLRGLDDGKGVYFIRPEEETIRDWCSILTGSRS